MSELDVYYRALLNYRAETTKDRECTRLRRSLSQADAGGDSIEIIRNICRIDEEWIIEIEKGLVFIEKAIKEERQFIYSQGEVEPIEKVKHIAKDSVIHLAKHSNLITKEQTGNDIIPDQLYNVERLNDYAVYENRFLYMLLCYLRDFVTLRYNNILDLTNKYDGKLTMNKEVTLPKRSITYSVELHDVISDDKYLRQNNEARDIIDRIDLILKTILTFMATPLMEFAAKAVQLKPPITKTNVLKMDNNFKGAVALYDFIIAYDKPGYTVECKNVTISPFGEEIADEISEAGSLLSFLTYEYGLGIKSVLKANYEAEERRRREALIIEKNEQIAALKRRLGRDGVTLEDYILEIEKHLKLLQNDNKQIIPLRARIEELEASEAELKANVARLEAKCAELEAECARFKAELEEANIRYERDMQKLRDEHAEEIKALNAAHEEEIQALNTAHKEELEALAAAHIEEIESINASHEEQIRLINETHSEEISELEEKMAAENTAWEEKVEGIKAEMADREGVLRSEIDALSNKIEEEKTAYEALSDEYHKLDEEKDMCQARIKALRVQSGDLAAGEEFTEKQAFDSLEAEFKAFEKFYKQCWNQTKKKIRKTELNYKKLKEQSGQNDKP